MMPQSRGHSFRGPRILGSPHKLRKFRWLIISTFEFRIAFLCSNLFYLLFPNRL